MENKLVAYSRNFPLYGRVLEVSESFDVFNSYRLMFRNYANQAANELATEYINTIYDLDTFLANFPALYNSKLDIVIKKAMDILISEEIWTVTYDSLINQHIRDWHLAIDDYNIMVQSFNLTVEANQQRKANTWGYVPTMIGGGFGFGGMVKGIATATAYNLVRDGFEASSMNTLRIKPEQRIELYNRLNVNLLFDRVFLDYWRVFLSLIFVLNQNGRNIWWPSDDQAAKAANIFTNMSHPNFPQDQIIDMMIQIFQMQPYNIEYYKYFMNKFGDSEEFQAIRNYYGYIAFDNPRIM